MKLFLFGFVVGALMLSYSGQRYYAKVMGWEQHYDFWVYRQAALGDFGNGWVYKNWLAPAFLPLTVGPEPFSVIWWTGLLSTSYLFLVWRLLYVEHGWIIVLITLKSAIEIISAGNVAILLLLLALSPIGAVLAVLLKPHFAGVGIIMAFGCYFAEKYRKADGPRRALAINPTVDCIASQHFNQKG